MLNNNVELLKKFCEENECNSCEFYRKQKYSYCTLRYINRSYLPCADWYLLYVVAFMMFSVLILEVMRYGNY